MAERPGYLEPEALLRETRWLRRLAAGLVGAGDAEDLVQDTWLKAVEHPPREPGLRHWLRRVAIRASLRALARERWRRGWERGGARDEALPSAAEAVERVALQREIVDAVLGLAEPYRSTMVLHYFEDLPAAEIARRENIPAATVRTRIHRALAQLRERLDAGAGGRASWSAILTPVAAKAAGISGAGGAAAIAGAILMTKSTIAAASVLVAVGLGAWFWLHVPSETVMPGRPVDPPVAGTAAGGEETLPTLEPAVPIAGRVVDQDGKPVASSTVVANLSVGRTFSRQEQVVTGEDGGFRIDDATAQPWEIYASPPEPREEWSSGPMRTVRGGEPPIEIVLRHHEPGRARVIADVVDAVTGAPVDPVEARLTKVKLQFAGDRSFLVPAPALREGGADFERIRPGAWSLSVRLSDGSRTTREFRIGDVDNVIRLRVPIGRPGAVEGRVVFDGIPSHLVPQSVGIFTIPGHAGQWVLEKNGEAAPNATRGFARAAAEDGFRFRFEDVPPDTPVRLYFTGKEILGAADFVAGFGEEKSVEIQAVVAATLVFRGTDARDAFGIVVQTGRDGGGWEDVFGGPSDDATGWKCRTACVPGTVRWRVERHARGAVAGSDPPAVAEGSVDIAPGAVREIEVTFPR